MEKIDFKIGSRLVCIPCGREVIVEDCGASSTAIWCCGEPMRGEALVEDNLVALERTDGKRDS